MLITWCFLGEPLVAEGIAVKDGQAKRFLSSKILLSILEIKIWVSRSARRAEVF
jgi:hypothetical protein